MQTSFGIFTSSFVLQILIPKVCKVARMTVMEVEQRHVHVVAVCLIIAIVLSVCSSFQIENVCMKVYDLEYQLTGYNCLFKGSGIYTYTASNLVNKITFDRIDSYTLLSKIRELQRLISREEV